MSYHTRGARFFASTCHVIAARLAAVALLALCFFALAPDAARAQSAGPSDVVISQLYTRGGETGATYQSDYIELFNRGPVGVDINGYALEVRGAGNVTTVISFRSSF